MSELSAQPEARDMELVTTTRRRRDGEVVRFLKRNAAHELFPRGIAASAYAKNVPPAHFLYAAVELV